MAHGRAIDGGYFATGTFTAAITFAKSATEPMGTRVNVTRRDDFVGRIGVTANDGHLRLSIASASHVLAGIIE